MVTRVYRRRLSSNRRYACRSFFLPSFHSFLAGSPFTPCTISPSSFLVRNRLLPLSRSRAIRIIIMDETLLLIVLLIGVFFMACTARSFDSSQASTTSRSFTESYCSNIHNPSSTSSPSLTSIQLFAVAIILVLIIASVLIALVPLFPPSHQITNAHFFISSGRILLAIIVPYFAMSIIYTIRNVTPSLLLIPEIVPNLVLDRSLVCLSHASVCFSLHRHQSRGFQPLSVAVLRRASFAAGVLSSLLCRHGTLFPAVSSRFSIFARFSR